MVYSLCDLLGIVYQRVSDFASADLSVSAMYADAFLRLDSRFKVISLCFTLRQTF